MKKIDKLILSSFIGPFILTFLVVVFILLMQHMLKYFEDIVGKDLGWDILGQLLFYFAVFMTPIAMPLAVLLSSLMTYGNLGEHFELTAIKSSGISLLRTLRPIFFFVIALTVFAYYSNNNFVPKAALEAYSLLFDIKQKKPALDLRPGAFYNGIPDMSIKVEKRYADGETIEGVMIYDHRRKNGNKEVILADSGKMYTIMNERYLVLELFRGQNFSEGQESAQDYTRKQGKPESLSRTAFVSSKLIFDLSSFNLQQTDKRLFEGNRIMRNLRQLTRDVDSLKRDETKSRYEVFTSSKSLFNFHLKDTLDVPADLMSVKLHLDSTLYGYRNIRYDADQGTPSSPRSVARDTNRKTARPVVDTATPSKASSKGAPRAQPAKEKTPAPGKTKSENPAPDRLKRLPELVPLDTLLNSLPTGQDSLGVDSLRAMLTEEALKRLQKDSLALVKPTREEILQKFVDNDENPQSTLAVALNIARQAKSRINGNVEILKNKRENLFVYQIQWHKILSNTFACVVMFLIGAPLGAIIKRGGLGLPVLVSIFFFIIFYVLNMLGEKWAKQGIVEPWLGVWMANMILLPIGFMFLKQARNDSRLFEADFYKVYLERLMRWFSKRSARKNDLKA
jgi:lipopolysaccharide export system permease protein